MPANKRTSDGSPAPAAAAADTQPSAQDKADLEAVLEMETKVVCYMDALGAARAVHAGLKVHGVRMDRQSVGILFRYAKDNLARLAAAKQLTVKRAVEIYLNAQSSGMRKHWLERMHPDPKAEDAEVAEIKPRRSGRLPKLYPAL